MTPAALYVLDAALEEARAAGSRTVGIDALWLALYHWRDPEVDRLLRAAGLPPPRLEGRRRRAHLEERVDLPDGRTYGRDPDAPRTPVPVADMELSVTLEEVLRRVAGKPVTPAAVRMREAGRD